MNHFSRPWCPHGLRGTITQANPQNPRRDAVTVHVEAASQQAEVRPTGMTCSPPSIPPIPLYQLPNTCKVLHTAIQHLQSHQARSWYPKDRETKFMYTNCPTVNCAEHLKVASNFEKPEALQRSSRSRVAGSNGALPDGSAGKICCRRRKSSKRLLKISCIKI